MAKSDKTKTFQKRGVRLAANNKAKKIAKTKGQKPSSVKKDHHEKKAETFLKAMIKAKVPSDMCPHHLIGSSSVFAFLQGRHSFKKAHAAMRTTPEARIVGAAGEESYLRKAKNITKMHPFAIGREQPWICASPDFLLFKSDKNHIVEVKTFSNDAAAASCFCNTDNRTVVQLWLSMELFGCQRGELRVYTVDQIARRCTLFGVVKLERQVPFLDKTLAAISCLQYSRFVDEYLEMQNITPPQNYFNLLAKRLHDRQNSRLVGPNLGKEKEARHPIRRTFKLTCPFFDESVVGDRVEFTEMIPYKELFSNFTWVCRSQKSRVLRFDDEARSDILKAVLANLSRDDLGQLEALMSNASQVKTTDQFRSEKSTKFVNKIEALHQKTKEEILQEKVMILEEQNRLAVETNNRLEGLITAQKAQISKLAKTKRSEKNAKRRRAERSQKQQAVIQDNDNKASETTATGTARQRVKIAKLLNK